MGALKSFILSVLGILTPQDLKYLAEASKERAPQFKKAAGGELLLWEDEAPIRTQEARVLDFPTRREQEVAQSASHESAADFMVHESPLEAIGVLSAEKQAELKRAAAEEYEKSKPDTLDFMLTERERFKDSEEKIFKQNGLASYRRNSDLRLYRVTTTDDKGKEKVQVKSTLGVLVDKKQS